jgi:glutathione-regulated potassium-efflux system protein KefB
VALVTMTMAFTPLLVALAPRLIRERTREREESFAGVQGNVLLVGFGRFGQVVSQLLLRQGCEVTAIDNDIEMIEAAERFGFKVYYGDGARLDVLRAAGADRARLICVCVEKKETTTKIVEIAREAFPLAKIFGRAFDRIHAIELIERGVHYQMRETYESAIAYGRAALATFDVTDREIAELEEDVRRRDRERFALQQQGDSLAGADRLVTRPVPRPEPLVDPKRKGVALNPEEVAEAAKGD